MQKIDFSLWEKLPSVMQEEFNSLYSNLLFCGDNRVFGIISSEENEGKSYIAMELMRTAALDGKKVLFIDTDLRKSHIETYYGSAPHNKGIRKGLTHYLSNLAEFDEVLCEAKLDEDGTTAYAILIGDYPPNPTKLLNSARFAELIERARAEFDFVVVDMAPVGRVIDGAIVGRLCDGVAIVVNCGKTNFRYVQESKNQLAHAGVNIFGVILNKASPDVNNYYKKYYKRKYGKYVKYGTYTYGSLEAIEEQNANK